ncbi:DUF222 domain-containing protein [Angustibacter sp. McL0619]|uniref:HNH endonuclease signature motif containing protein n=1 Tax=Angustibacter sp. McL0619 TaxID=3415676 RepID=UPI003CE70E5B
MTSAPTDESGAASAALADALAALDRFAAVEGWRLAEAELGEALAGLDRLARRVGAQAVRVVAEAEARGLPGQGGHARAAGWVAQVVPTMSGRQAAALGRRAGELFTGAAAVDLGPTRAAVLAGAVGLDQADIITATITALQPPTVPAQMIDADTVDEAQAFLLEQAGVFEAGKLRRLAGYLRDRLDPDTDTRLARDEAARDRARTLTLAATESGMVHLQGTLTPACGAALTTAIDAWSAPQPASAPADAGTADPRTGAQRRHDGLHQLAATAVAAPDQLPSSHGSPYRILLTVPHTTLTTTLTNAALTSADPAAGLTGLAPATLPDGTPLSSTALQTIACEADLVPVLVDDVGNPLDVGDTQYAFPTRQRTAIALRDQHCTYPACTAPPPWCDIHHLTPFSRGGRTAVTNGALLCGRHHRHIHQTRATGQIEHGHVHWNTTPPGSPASSQTASPTSSPTSTHQPCLTRAHQALDHLIHRHLTRLRR